MSHLKSPDFQKHDSSINHFLSQLSVDLDQRLKLSGVSINPENIKETKKTFITKPTNLRYKIILFNDSSTPPPFIFGFFKLKGGTGELYF